MRTDALESSVPSFSGRLFALADLIDYRPVVSEEDRDAIFRLRYDAYLREEAIEPNFSKRLSDRYDDLDNTLLFGMYLDNELAATMRLSIATADYPEFPAMNSFSDQLQPYLDAGKVIIDPTRHATSEKFSKAYPGLLPFMTTRIAWMAGEYFHADLILATVRAEHQAFYKRVFGFQLLCDPKDYPTLIKPLSLMALDYPAARERVHRRYPTFRSTLFERRMMFDLGAPQISPSLLWGHRPAEEPEPQPLRSSAGGGH